ncbi:hypothetical protein BDN70DRAFT_902351 [Pholiota conissans]|uniref:Uncharacterized protein n=1 Tax=Pholiota conissans TaxID=109636 RepID=A0A9P5YM79_9AGAR|nr:hypothetical protein BDN70DRAFT_902351 [Pholiota conissans]
MNDNTKGSWIGPRFMSFSNWYYCGISGNLPLCASPSNEGCRLVVQRHTTRDDVDDAEQHRRSTTDDDRHRTTLNEGVLWRAQWADCGGMEDRVDGASSGGGTYDGRQRTPNNTEQRRSTTNDDVGGYRTADGASGKGETTAGVKRREMCGRRQMRSTRMKGKGDVSQVRTGHGALFGASLHPSLVFCSVAATPSLFVPFLTASPFFRKAQPCLGEVEEDGAATEVDADGPSGE